MGTSSGIRRNSGGRFLGSGTVAARLLHAPPRNPGSSGDPYWLPPFFLSSSAVSTTVTCKTTKNAASKSVVAFFLWFSVRLLFLPICQIRSVWIAGLATSLLPFHFCNGGVVHRCHGCEIGAHPSFDFLPLLHYPLASLLIVSVTSCWRREDAAVGWFMVVGREREDLIQSLMEKKKQNK